MKLKLWTLALLLVVGVSTAILAKPSVLRALGIGDNGGRISNTSLADMTERETNQKYGGTFKVHALNETQVGARFESILSERTDSDGEHDLFFHAAAFKVADYFRIQDDYELQKLVGPIVEDAMGSDAKLM